MDHSTPAQIVAAPDESASVPGGDTPVVSGVAQMTAADEPPDLPVAQEPALSVVEPASVVEASATLAQASPAISQSSIVETIVAADAAVKASPDLLSATNPPRPGHRISSALTTAASRARAPVAHAACPAGFFERHGLKAAGVVFALGMGWMIGANTFDKSAGQNQGFATALRSLDAKIDAIAAQNAHEEVASLRAGADQFKSGLEATRNNFALAVAQLTTRADRIDREFIGRQERFEKEIAARFERLTERLDRLERTAGAGAQTSTIPQALSQVPAPAAPAPVALPARQSRADDSRAPGGYYLRAVSNGVARLENRNGALVDVQQGDALPGAGRVRAIERRGRQWVVVTSNGVIE